MPRNGTIQAAPFRLRGTLLTIIFLVAVLLPASVSAQKGVGDVAGMARRPARPDLICLSGVLEKIDTHPCESTTGWALLGTHLIVKNDQGQQLNIHLGPTAAVEDIAAQLTAGMRLEIVGFQTKKMPSDQYVATKLILEEKIIDLRDAGLRPYWAGAGLHGQGPAYPNDWAVGLRGRGWMRPYADLWPGCPRRPYRGGRYGRCCRRGFRGHRPTWGWSGASRGLRREFRW